ncbi:MAG: hypothetical protein M3Q07_25165, partial [Pseudobdellovibrionaceae bacterium]|nr:hypothetical protein [Pseudobdellovibrionaceae bacterium]
SNNYSMPLTTTSVPIAATAPTSLAITATNQQLALSWASGGGTNAGYVVVRNSGAGVTFTPVNGTSYSVGAVTGGQVVKNGTTLSNTDTGLTNGTTYYYKVWSYDSNQIYTASASTSGAPINCTGTSYDKSCWFRGTSGNSCQTTCTANSLSFDAAAFARHVSTSGSPLDPAQCVTLYTALGISTTGLSGQSMGSSGSAETPACGNNGTYIRGYPGINNDGSRAVTGISMVCPCNY